MPFFMIVLVFGLFASCDSSEEPAKADDAKPAAVEKAESVMKSIPCAVCEKLKAGGTGWCAECDKGYFEGKEVNCTGQCRANPGGPPCEACVK
jgi:hypothetical protein